MFEKTQIFILERIMNGYWRRLADYPGLRDHFRITPDMNLHKIMSVTLNKSKIKSERISSIFRWQNCAVDHSSTTLSHQRHCGNFSWNKNRYFEYFLICLLRCLFWIHYQVNKINVNSASRSGRNQSAFVCSIMCM